MSHELFRLMESVKTKPLLITAEGLAGSMAYLESRNSADFEMSIAGGRKVEPRQLNYVDTTKTGVIKVDGPLSYIQYEAVCGEEQTSYQRLEAEFDQLVKMGAKTIVFDFDTPGGMAYSVFETSQRFREIADKNGIKLIGYVDGSAYSAGYAILSAMHEKIGNPDCGVGSIGVLVHLQNINKAKKAAGIEDKYIYAGDNKIPFNAEGDFRKEFLSKIGKDVKNVYTKFVNHVAEMTGIEASVIANTEADTFNAEEGLAIGLLDAVMTREQFFSHLADVAENQKEGRSMDLSKTLAQNEDNSGNMSAITEKELSELQAKLATSVDEVKTLTEKLATLETSNKELTGKVADATSKLEKHAAAQAEAEKKAEELKVKARESQLSAVLPSDQVAGMLESTKALDDASFQTVVGGFKKFLTAEENSEDFKETGISGEADKSKQDEKLSLVAKKIEQQKASAK